MLPVSAMEEKSNFVPPSSNGDEVLDVKPLRTLAPMFPAPLGLNTFSVPGARPLVCISPFSQHPFDFEAGQPSCFRALPQAFLNSATAEGPNPGPVDPVPKPTGNVAANAGVFANANVHQNTASLSPSCQTPPAFSPISQTPSPIVICLDEDDSPEPDGSSSASGRKIKQPMPLRSCSMGNSDTVGSGGKKVTKRKQRPRKTHNTNLALLPALSREGPRETVEAVLMTFDALRRRILQMDEVTNTNKRADLRAGNILMNNDLRANKGKKIGTVPGIEVGDIFYFRIEICLVGLHAQTMGGIDYMTAKFDDGEDPIAISVVSAGGYENEDDDVDTLIYSGQGGVVGKQAEKKQGNDQKLERGNLALERSLHRGNQIRVIRSAKDFNIVSGKIYIYDGLYKIETSWMEKAKSGFHVFKYKLVREPDQPDGMAIWKMTQKWIENPSSRGRVILPDISSGIENIPVCLVNDVDDEKCPSHFTYVTTAKHLRLVSSQKSLKGCMCLSVCLPGDASCSCVRQNGGNLPYSSTGFLVKRKSLIYECNDSCQCSINCRNRVTQKGVRLHFEVFRTRDRGWGLRSWDPIRAGTFICEYTGEVIDKIKMDEDEYIFQTSYTDEKTFKWNYGPELLGEQNPDSSNEITKQLPIVISAKNMGNISRFMNHSCSPNVFWQPIQYDHEEEGYPHIMFFAIKHIPPMTELTYAYDFSGAESACGIGSRRGKECLCGSSNCRGLFGKH